MVHVYLSNLAITPYFPPMQVFLNDIRYIEYYLPRYPLLRIMCNGKCAAANNQRVSRAMGTGEVVEVSRVSVVQMEILRFLIEGHIGRVPYLLYMKVVEQYVHTYHH